jgi:hypothetical protein
MKQTKLHSNLPLAGESQKKIYAPNAQKRDFTRKQLIEYKNTLKLTSEQKDILIGTLLGDASMSIRSDKPHYSVKFEQGESHKDYIDHLYQIFLPYTGSPPSMRFIDSKKTRRAYWFRTYKHKHFMYYFHLFYVITPNHENVENTSPKYHKVKIVPKNIHKYLTPRALAYWFMDDGTFYSTSRPRVSKKHGGSGKKNYVFSTQGFQKHEVKRLCDALRYKFNIRANVHRDKKNWRIYILKESSTTFVDLIRPYIHQSFLYKI